MEVFECFVCSALDVMLAPLGVIPNGLPRTEVEVDVRGPAPQVKTTLHLYIWVYGAKFGRLPGQQSKLNGAQLCSGPFSSSNDLFMRYILYIKNITYLDKYF